MKMHRRLSTHLLIPGGLVWLMIVAVGAQQSQTSHPPEPTTLSSPNTSVTTLNSTNPTATTLNSTNPTATTLNSTNPTATALNSTNPTATTLNSTNPTATTLSSTNPTATTLNSTNPNATTLSPPNPNTPTLNPSNPNNTTLNSSNANITTFNSPNLNITAFNSPNPIIPTLNSTNPNATALNSSNPNATALNSSNPNATTLNSPNTNATTLSSPNSPNSTNLTSPITYITTLSSPNSNVSTSNSSVLKNQTDGMKINNGDVLYDACRKKQGIICYGDKRNCIMLRTCTFLGAIFENDTSINVTVLTRVYNPPYNGMNLTVELQRTIKGNGSAIICTRPRFKNIKIRLSWQNKIKYESGNGTQLATTIIDKDQLKNACLRDQATSNNTNLPSQTLALKFYLGNNNTLVLQGLTRVDVQAPTTTAPPATTKLTIIDGIFNAFRHL
ncbi:unnamed protein product [Allacma fusca]|uniref:Uncharacterized protein n=1 Tax=Allacma fusca TaxID=39272 RepID=A0A8J2L3T1_9HEXA|nr:unnamed protein product [Allacma fusca]